MRRLVIVQENGVEFGDKKWIYLMEIAASVCESANIMRGLLYISWRCFTFLCYFNLSFVVVRARAFICLFVCVCALVCSTHIKWSR